MLKNNRTKIRSVAFREDLLKRLDRDRGDITRSKYLMRILEKAFSMGESVRD